MPGKSRKPFSIRLRRWNCCDGIRTMVDKSEAGSRLCYCLIVGVMPISNATKLFSWFDRDRSYSSRCTRGSDRGHSLCHILFTFAVQPCICMRYLEVLLIAALDTVQVLCFLLVFTCGWHCLLHCAVPFWIFLHRRLSCYCWLPSTDVALQVKLLIPGAAHAQQCLCGALIVMKIHFEILSWCFEIGWLFALRKL